MSDTSSSTLSFEHRYNQALAALVPFFLNETIADAETAREAAKSILDCHHAATPKELQLATEIVAYGWGSLACLGAASAVKQVSLDEMMDWQDSAIKLNSLCMKSTRALEARQKERAKNPKGMKPENLLWDEGAFQLGINRALEKVMLAHAKLKAFMDSITPPTPVVVVKPKVKMPILFAEQMTPSVLARRARH
jgi:hypothetical protein